MPADVRSLEELREFLSAIEHFRSHLSKELESLQLEMRRLGNWIQNEAGSYWSNEYSQAQRRFTEAKENLTRCMSCVRADEQRPCTEERKQVQRMKERRELCELKLKTQKAADDYWSREAIKNQAKVQHCRDLAESGLLSAALQLRDQIERLESYMSLRTQPNSQIERSQSSSTSDDSTEPNDAPIDSATTGSMISDLGQD